MGERTSSKGSNSAPTVHRDVAVLCARCHVEFNGVEALRLCWCTVDRFLVCRKCWETGCQEGHGRGVKAIRKAPGLVTWSTVLAVLLLLWYVPVSYDYDVLTAWHDASITPIASVRSGDIVKVFGTMESQNSAAFGGHEEYYSRAGWEWRWNTTDSFVLRDASGSILVTTDRWYLVYNGPHAAGYATHTAGTAYAPGDSVQIVGTEGLLPNGTAYLHLQVIESQQGLSFGLPAIAPSPFVSAARVVLPLGAVGVVAPVIAVLFARRRAHERIMSDQGAMPVELRDEVRDPSLNWIPNGRGTLPRHRHIGALVIIGAGIALLLVYPGPFPHADSGYWLSGFLGSLVIFVVGFVSFMLLFGSVTHPSFVAVGTDGFRLWYDSPVDRHLNNTVFPWSQIQRIAMTTGRGAHWYLRWTTGEVDNLYMLSSRNLALLREEWLKRGTVDL